MPKPNHKIEERRCPYCKRVFTSPKYRDAHMSGCGDGSIKIESVPEKEKIKPALVEPPEPVDEEREKDLERMKRAFRKVEDCMV